MNYLSLIDEILTLIVVENTIYILIKAESNLDVYTEL